MDGSSPLRAENLARPQSLAAVCFARGGPGLPILPEVGPGAGLGACGTRNRGNPPVLRRFCRDFWRPGGKANVVPFRLFGFCDSASSIAPGPRRFYAAMGICGCRGYRISTHRTAASVVLAAPARGTLSAACKDVFGSCLILPDPRSAHDGLSSVLVSFL